MAGNNDFSSVLYEALVETLNAIDSKGSDCSPCVKLKSEGRTVRVDLQGVTIERMAFEVTKG